MYFYTDFPILRWDHVQPGEFARYRLTARQAGIPVRAVIFNLEAEALQRQCPGNWSRLASLGKIGLWELVDD
jgi:hypothetical protein